MEKLQAWLSSLKIDPRQIDAYVRSGVSATYLVLIAYVCSVAASGLIAKKLANETIATLARGQRVNSQTASSGGVKGLRTINFHRLKSVVVERNLFNSDGEVPEEAEPGVRSEEVVAFDMEAPCQKNTLNLDLLGTIYMGVKAGSLATVKEKGYSQADVYRVGDGIFGAEDARIVAIGQRRVIINNRGQKECLELKDPELANSADYGSDNSITGVQTPQNAPSGQNAGDVTLDAAYVEKELGEGYVNILNKARLVPFNQNGVMKGFKLIGLDSKSLIGKVGLKNQDVITQVNDTSLQQPDQGFAFFQAFEDEQEIRISFLRNGTTPMTINVKIK